MDVFALRDELKAEHQRYFESFVQIADERIRAEVEAALAGGLLWPHPRVALNPAFEPGATVDELVGRGRLDPLAGEIFRARKSEQDPVGKPMTLHRHQTEAIDAAAGGRSYVLTTGTGSGKSLAYIVPIVDHVLRAGSGKGIKALVLYPMNALANSQSEELAKFLDHGPEAADGSPWQQPVSFALFTGQQDEHERRRLRENPPDILLTNYVMAEFILTRHIDRDLVKAMSQMRFLVLDELHTYRGRQGADVAMLVRRIREASGAEGIQCVGTSATLSTEGTAAERDIDVAHVASKLFGTEVRAEDVISETLRRVTCEQSEIPGFDEKLKRSVSEAGNGSEGWDFESLRRDPLAVWIESAFGVATDDNDRLRRADPLPIEGPEGAGVRLSALTGLAVGSCEEAIRWRLLAGASEAVAVPETGLGVFAFRLHQFFGSSGAAYATAESPAGRSITMRAQRFVAGDRQRAYLPLAFCRWCGQEYYVVRRETSADHPGKRLVGRDLSDTDTSVGEPGFLFIDPRAAAENPQRPRDDADQRDEGGPWPLDSQGIRGRLPADWYGSAGRLRDSLRDAVPEPLRVAADGTVLHSDIADGNGAVVGFWLRARFRFCMACEVSHAEPRGSDFTRLAPLDSQGRSTATTITSIAAVRHLRSRAELPVEARKLLSFTDNRQDASLQSGHLNDFVGVALLRAGLWKALGAAGEVGLRHDSLASQVVEAMNLPAAAYALNPKVEGPATQDASDALEDVVAYRLYLDLRRGWRVNLPNLEQCGMLRIDYRGLDKLADDDSKWHHPLLDAANAKIRHDILKALLDTARRRLAINVNVLERVGWRRMEARSDQNLRDPWSITGERHQPATELATGPHSPPGCVALTPRSSFGRFLNRSTVLGGAAHLRLEDRREVIEHLVEALDSYGLVCLVEADPRRHGRQLDEGIRLWRVPAAAIEWRRGDGTPYQDPILMPAAPRSGMRPNPYFSRLYETTATERPTKTARAETTGEPVAPIEAREHTAQVPHEQRQEREHRFRDGKLPVLFCSPTMELGVDIAELNVVHMRNVPPTPANYAQRSGRAGRSGQPALVTTFCSSGNSHDQYFFTQQHLMVSGQVQAPRLDLANEELIRAHVHAIWLSEGRMQLGSRMSELLDLEGDPESLPLAEHVSSALQDKSIRRGAHRRAQQLLEGVSGELSGTDWHSDAWLTDTMRALPQRFDDALNRWRSLYQSALHQANEQTRIKLAPASTKAQREQAERLRREAEHQLDLLTGGRGSGYNSDFYPYRYLASEGFLPGYSFPRLPLSAYVAGRGARGDLLQRPRFLAVSEFGPRSFIYHEGSQYLVNRVQLAVGDLDPASGAGSSIIKHSIKRCEDCGYMHPITNGGGPDMCESCSARLPPATRNMFFMGNVSTMRRNRITSDEEQRQRQGYDIVSGVQFSDRAGVRSQTTRTLRPAGADASSGPAAWTLRLTYGDAAQIWRINNGPRTRDEHRPPGFLVDPSTGLWLREDAADPDDNDDDNGPHRARPERVVPYVTDARNALLVEPSDPTADPLGTGPGDEGPAGALGIEAMASIQAALAKALQAVFQLEPSEIAVEPLPSRDDRRLLLVYEADEGGAGILKNLVTDAEAWQKVAAEALRICHTSPAGTADERPDGPEACEAVCYDCLMSYSNQLDHGILDRDRVVEFLAPFAKGAEFAPDAVDAQLTLNAESSLERQFLEFLQTNGYRRPDRSQVFFEDAMTRPDFVYDDACAVVYVDGPHHDFPQRARRDTNQSTAMSSLGYRVIRFAHHDDWQQVAAAHPAVFGPGERSDTARIS